MHTWEEYKPTIKQMHGFFQRCARNIILNAKKFSSLPLFIYLLFKCLCINSALIKAAIGWKHWLQWALKEVGSAKAFHSTSLGMHLYSGLRRSFDSSGTACISPFKNKTNSKSLWFPWDWINLSCLCGRRASDLFMFWTLQAFHCNDFSRCNAVLEK